MNTPTSDCVQDYYGIFLHCTFTGKELDEETGYGYFGARYMDHELLTGWLSVDPMADKYPSISPYAYCAWNPVKLVDPDGREWDPASEEKYIKPYKNEINARIGMIVNKRKETGNPNLYSDQLNEYNNILSELDAMGNDSKNVYKINGDCSFNDKNTFGEVTNGMRMKYNFSLNVDRCILPPTDVYRNMPDKWNGSVNLNPCETLLLNRHYY